MIKILTILNVENIKIDNYDCEFTGPPHNYLNSIVFYLDFDEKTSWIRSSAYGCCSLHMNLALGEQQYNFVSNKYFCKFYKHILKKSNAYASTENRLFIDNFKLLNK